MVTLAGDTLTSFSPSADPGLGIRIVAWHPSGIFLAIGGWDDKVNSKILNCLQRVLSCKDPRSRQLELVECRDIRIIYPNTVVCGERHDCQWAF